MIRTMPIPNPVRLIGLLLALSLIPSLASGAPILPVHPTPASPFGVSRPNIWDPIGCLVNCYCCSPIGGKGNQDCCLWCDNNCYGVTGGNTSLSLALRAVSPWIDKVATRVDQGSTFHDAMWLDPAPASPGHDWLDTGILAP